MSENESICNKNSNGGCATGCSGCCGNGGVKLVVIETKDNKQLECEALGIFEVEGQLYIALLSTENEDDLFFYKFLEEECDAFIEAIESDEEYEKVAIEFDKILNDLE